MKALLQVVPVCGLLWVAATTGCATNSNNEPDINAETGTLYQQLGGADKVVQLGKQWGANIATTSILTDELDKEDINQLEAGLANDIMTASGMTPASTITVATALADEDFEDFEADALSNTLREAGAQMGLNPTLMSKLATTIVEPAARNRVGQH